MLQQKFQSASREHEARDKGMGSQCCQVTVNGGRSRPGTLGESLPEKNKRRWKTPPAFIPPVVELCMVGRRCCAALWPSAKTRRTSRSALPQALRRQQL